MALRGFTYDGINSLDYGIGITGESVYNAPERDIEVIEVPGRNGNYILDNGKFKNIEAVYQAGMADREQPDFAERVSEFRNELLSRVGYKRLEDDYHPDEYRLAYCTGGFNLSASHNSTAGEFDVKFNCKPQRFLKSGESAIEISSGDTITNPTLFNSHPLISFNGGGAMSINDDTISVVKERLGEQTLWTAKKYTGAYQTGEDPMYLTWSFDVNPDLFMPGDKISLQKSAYLNFVVNLQSEAEREYKSAELTSHTGTMGDSVEGYSGDYYGIGNILTIGIHHSSNNSNRLDFVAGTSKRYIAENVFNVVYEDSGVSKTGQVVFQEYFEYDGAVTFTFYGCVTDSSSNDFGYVEPYVWIGGIMVDSTVTNQSKHMFVDFEVGEAYMIIDGEKVSVNGAVNLGVELPVLKPGNNTITFAQNTFSNVAVIPRWWII